MTKKKISRRASKTKKKFSKFCRTLLTVNISEMAQVLTDRNIRSKSFIKRMFTCITPGTTNPNDENWVPATYISKKLENGFNVGVCNGPSLIHIIEPFTEGLFQATFYGDRRMRDYALKFSIQIKTENELVWVGEFYFRSDRNPFKPKMEGLELNWDFFHYLEHPYKILVTSSFTYSLRRFYAS